MERDWLSFTSVSDGVDFNSHAHVERDCHATLDICFCDISTHTLTWSVTAAPCIAMPWLINFNSHAHVERDEFNCRPCRNCLNFNSHAHVERDQRTAYRRRAGSISTHTLTWSVTLYSTYRPSALRHFNSHAHVERDDKHTTIKNAPTISTHTLTWSVTMSHRHMWRSRLQFQLTRSRGA